MFEREEEEERKKREKDLRARRVFRPVKFRSGDSIHGVSKPRITRRVRARVAMAFGDFWARSDREFRIPV